jgi:molybdopterin-containing oxidoreductase family iron-sulfur binding subunit
LFDTKQLQDINVLDGLTGKYYDYLKASSAFISGSSWNKVYDGVYVGESSVLSGAADYGTAAATLARAKKVDNFELVLYTKTGMGDGQQANNPWLQEFPDPIKSFMG